MGLTAQQIPDLVNTTLPHFKNRGRFEAAFELQQYFFIQEVFQQDKYGVQDGTQIESTVVLDGNGTARHTSLYDEHVPSQKDVSRLATQNWKYAEAYAVYESRELLMNRGASAKAKYIKTKYFAAYKDLANLIERRAVLSPESASDQINPHGVSWALSMLGAGQEDYTGGFNGQTARYADGTTTTTKYGIDASVEWLWRNWVATHTGMNLTTMETMRRGMLYTSFMPPTSIKEIFKGPAAKWRILWSIAYQAEYERLVNQGNDNRNGDLSPFKGVITFRGVRTVGLPTLENASYSPIYCVNFARFRPVVHSQWWMKEDEVLRHPNQRHVHRQGIDCWYNYFCDNIREAGFVLHTPIPA